MPANDTPAWFSRLDRLPPYSEICVDDDKAEEVLKEIFTLWDHPELAVALHVKWNALGQFQQRVRADVAAKDWSLEGGHQLIEYLIANAALESAVSRCLPERLKAIFPPQVFQFVFDNLLMAQSEQWMQEHPDDLLTDQSLLNDLPHAVGDLDLSLSERSMLPLKRTIVIREASPYVEDEIVRRARSQLGFPAAVLILDHWIQNWIQNRPHARVLDPEESIRVAIDKLRASSYGMANQRIAQVMKAQTGWEGETKTTLQQHLSGQVWETCIRTWGKYEALDALARALDGEMNIAAQAIVDDIIDNLRHIFPEAAASYMTQVPTTDGMKRRRHFVDEVPFVEETDDTARAEQSIRIRIQEVSKREHLAQENELMLKQLRTHRMAFLQHYPKHKDGLELYLYDGPLTQQELAKARKCTVQTLHNRMKSALRAFRKYLNLNAIP